MAMRLVRPVLLCLLLLATPAFAVNISTADPDYPQTLADIDAGPMRDQNRAFINDIDNLWAAIGPNFLEANQILGALESGKARGISIPSCFGPTNAITWSPGAGFGCNDIQGGGGGGDLGPQAALTVLRGPLSGLPTDPTFGPLTGEYLPLPTTNTIGGVKSATAAAHQFMNGISNTGAALFATPAFPDVSGTVSPSQLPLPTASSIGGVESIGVVGHNFVTGISALGVPTQAQPYFTDISGNIAVSQMASGSGASSTTCWKGDGTWGACTGSVSVTSSSPNLTVNPSPGTGVFALGLTELIVPLGSSTSNPILSSYMGKTLTHNSSSSVADSLPQAGTLGFSSGVAFTELNLGSAAVTITPTVSTINGTSSLVVPACSAPPACPWAYMISDGTNYAALVK
jgi:hypothetical protein